jgi:hypothetical protein
MEKKQKLFLGFAVIVMAIITMVSGCKLDEETATFPSSFIGTWERAYQSAYTNTLTFTSDTLRDSSQNGYWNLISVSGDAYTIAWYNDSNWKFTDTIRLVGGNLEISGNSAGTGEDNWDGTWKKR